MARQSLIESNRSACPSFCILHSAFRISSRSGQARLQRLERSDCGQAMVEFTVALIVIMVLVAGLIQIGRITSAHTRTMIAARAEAAQAAMAGVYNQPLGGHYIYSWMAGTDTKRYTHDDVPSVATNAVEANLAMVALAQPGELEERVPNNALSTLGTSPDSLDEFFLVRGHESESCPTLSIIRSLVYDRESISVESDAWLVWTEGIY